MSSSRASDRPLELTVRNVGGIDRTEAELEPGITVLEGRNATNRTSLLQAIMAALGSDRATLKGDADEGEVSLSLDGDRYTRSLTRTGDGVSFAGDPYLDDATLADLYAFLVEANEARRAVEQGEDLRELLMRPVDTEALQAEIERLQDEQRELERDLAALDDLETRRRELTTRREELDTELSALREELSARRAELEAADADLEASREDQAAFESAMESLEAARSDLDDLRFELESTRESLSSAREEREEVATALAELPEPDDGVAVDERLDELRDEKAEIEDTLNDLQNLIRVNQELLDGNEQLTGLLREETGEQDVAAGLLPDAGTDVCWSCGSEVETSQFEATLERLRELSRQLRSERNRVADEIDDLDDARRERERRERRRTELDERLERLDAEIAEREAVIEERTAEREALEARIEELEDRVAALDSERYDEILDLHRETNRLEFEIDDLESERDSVDADLESIDDRLEERSDLVDERERVQSELETARTQVDRIERDAVAGFNDHMDALLDRLAYDNLERIWIERRGTDDRATAGAAAFELHVVRSTAAGATYEDTAEHLSESEREVTGLVFALAGYLTHEVHEELPVIVLDSLEAIDADRIARLVDYFSEYARYVVVALLPEDAAAIDATHRIEEI